MTTTEIIALFVVSNALCLIVGAVGGWIAACWPADHQDHNLYSPER